MTSITQDMKYRLSLIQYAEKSWRYQSCHQIQNQPSVYLSLETSVTTALWSPYVIVPDVLILIPISILPEEIKLIQDMRRRNPHAGLVIFWVKLTTAWLYNARLQDLYRFLKKARV